MSELIAFIELQIRSKAIKDVAATFEAIESRSLISASEEDLEMSNPKLTNFYDEVSQTEVFEEIPRLRRHLKALKNKKNEQHWTF